jgi:hypothetical protein
MLAVSVSTLAADSTSSAVWQIKIDQDPALNMRFRWEVNVKKDDVKKPGRIWTDEVRISQINSKESPVNSEGEPINLTYYAQRSDGYRYKITQKGYNGFGSTFKAGAFGVGLSGESECISAYASVELPTQDLWPMDVTEYGMPTYQADPLGETGKSLDNLSKCSGMASYRIFFEEPDSDLPEDTIVAGWDSAHTFRDLYRDEPVDPEITVAFVTTDNYIGKVVVDSHGTYYGNATLEIDADGDNHDDFEEVATFGITENGAEIQMDGTRDNDGGAQISLGTLVKGRIVLSYLGEIHIIAVDVEQRDGGIEVERKNGGDDNRYQLFWNDDTPWLSATRATISPQFKSILPNGTNSSGGIHGWEMPETYASCSNSFSAWAITDTMKSIFTNNSIWCPFDKIGHFNERTIQSWGDNRAIEDWTFDIDRTELLREDIREDSYFEYIFTDDAPEEKRICDMSNAEFAEYYVNLTTDNEKISATAERLTCERGKKSKNCEMSLSELFEIIGDYDQAVDYWRGCQKQLIIDKPPDSPPTGEKRKYY